ncbi:MAG: hypothetical protein P1P76_05805 [Anaerolineales bacterium]|nr:hypothetical protein [Anaerolineales bacterium]
MPGCTLANGTVTIPIVVTVASETGSPYPDLPGYAFNGESYAGYYGTTDSNGETSFTMPQGDYRFRSDLNGTHFWSWEANHCTIPGYVEAMVEIPGGVGEVDVTIDYSYNPLNRLTASDYSTGELFHYTYDAVGNRLSEQTIDEDSTYVYDNADRLTSVSGVDFSWSASGNLLTDGDSTYCYDHANRLTGLVEGGNVYGYSYNGHGDHLTLTFNGVATQYALDLNRTLTHVLSDGTNACL